ncbi:hypothetical protein SMA5143A_5190 [Streptomyces sp. MA5143a]|nr:hypothetical protein SMA5143A_5190 [Streptomyces sp. MA5143a]
MAIPMPDEGQVPVGPHRDLLLELHDLYKQAGQPGARRISESVREAELKDLVSHQTVSSMLKGDNIPRWTKLEAVVTVLAQWSVERPDVRAAVKKMHRLWMPTQSPTTPPNDESPEFALASQGHSGGQAEKVAYDLSSVSTLERWGITNVVQVGNGMMITVEKVDESTIVRVNAEHPVIDRFQVLDKCVEASSTLEEAQENARNISALIDALILSYAEACNDISDELAPPLRDLLNLWGAHAERYVKQGRSVSGRAIVIGRSAR